MVDTVKTRTELIHEALAGIGALEPGEAPSTEDYNTMDMFVDPVIGRLATRGVAYIDDSEAIPVEYFLNLANLVGNAAGPRFGSPINREAQKIDEAELREMASTKPTYAPLKMSPF